MKSLSSDDLREFARRIRVECIKMVYAAKSGHCGGPLSAADILAVLYGRFLNVRPGEPRWPDRDRFVLSKGHACTALYAALALKGFFDPAHLATLRQFGSLLQGHPSMKHTPGCDMSTGSLGQGLSCAGGMALGGKLQGKTFRVYALLSDGELDEGMTWEAALAIRQFGLHRLTAIVDYNHLQLDGFVEDVMALEPLVDKWRAFGWNVLECDGHDVDDLSRAISAAHAHACGPSVVIARTVKGKGVSYMENVCEWHGAVPNEVQYRQALAELGEPAEVAS